jgi:DNA invertase Pin-like site-specific DNA recombinase
MEDIISLLHVHAALTQPGETLISNPKLLSRLRAAQYVRMSTEHQQYSPANQTDAIAAYANHHGIEIVQTYADHGRSGLNLEGREGLRRLLDDVTSRRCDFSELLVFDISRWGRFQDADESAYYEYVCKRSGVIIHYCGEQFKNDGSLSSTLLKTIKRSMAAEYSRELSVKVFAGQSRLVELGYRQGGLAGFGLRRQLIDREGRVKAVLMPGERKSIQTDRIVLIPGPPEEIAVVQNIFDLYTVSRLSARGIATLLNERGVTTDRGWQWSKNGVQELLTNPKYVGSNVYNRRSYKLSQKAVRNPANMWIRRDGAFEPIVPLETFLKAQEIAQSKCINLSDDDLLNQLRRLWGKEGKISSALINKDETMPYVCAFRRRFRSLSDACSLIGYTPVVRDHKYQKAKCSLLQRNRDLSASVKAKLRSYGATVEEHGRSGAFIVNGQFTTRLAVCYCSETCGVPRWSVRLDRLSCPDVTIAVRLKPGNSEILDYFLLPNLDQLGKRVFIAKDNSCGLEVYRFDTLDFFLNLSRRCNLVQNA